jgi:hypothetical protein
MSRLLIIALAVLSLTGASTAALAQSASPAQPALHHAKGAFEVKMVPQEQDKAEGSTLGRLSLDKIFHGDLEGVGKGQMLTIMSDTPGSAVYVAVERVTGSLNGKAGSFALAHQGVMRGESRQLTVEIAPDSGSGALKGIAGRLTIDASGGQHLYDLEYTLPNP